MEIRKARYEDVQTLNNFLTLLIRDEKKYDGGINEEFEVTNMYENYIEDKTKLLIVAEEKGVVLGYLYGILKPKDEVYKYTIAKLDALYVTPAARHQGIAVSLIEEFKSWANRQKADRLEVNVWSQNTAAKKLYMKANFKTACETLVIEN